MTPTTRAPDRTVFEELAESSWVYVGSYGGRLHHAVELEDPEGWERRGFVVGLTTCGLAGKLDIPGLLSRMGVDRCIRCCDKLGIKRGTGSPKNDPELREWLGYDD